MSSAVRAAVPLGASSLRSWCSSMISALAMIRDASAAKRIMSTAPIAKFGATRTLPSPLASRRSRRGRSRSCPTTAWTPARDGEPDVPERGVGAGEVDEDVGVAEDVGDRYAQRRVGAPGELHVVGAARRRRRRGAHAPRGAGDRRRRIRRPRGQPRRRDRLERRPEGRLVAADARGAQPLGREQLGGELAHVLDGHGVDVLDDLVDATAPAARPGPRSRGGSSARRSTPAPSTVRPLTFSFERASSSAVAGSATKRSSSAPTTRMRRADVVGRVPT